MVDPHRMMRTHTVPPEGLFNRPCLHGVWFNVTATCCKAKSQQGHDQADDRSEGEEEQKERDG